MMAKPIKTLELHYPLNQSSNNSDKYIMIIAIKTGSLDNEIQEFSLA